MNELLQKRTVVSVLPTPTGGAGGPVDFNATGDKFILTPASPIDIYRWGFITDAAMDPDAGGFVLALDYRPTAGSDTSRAEKATITRADAETVAAGTIVFNNPVGADTDGETGEDSTLRFVAPTGPVRIAQGEQAVIEVTNAVGAAATGYVFIEYVELPFDETDATKETS